MAEQPPPKTGPRTRAARPDRTKEYRSDQWATAILNSLSAPFLRQTTSDLGVVISATTVIDVCLMATVCSKFRKTTSVNDLAAVFEGTGPLASFDAKIKLCSALCILLGDIKHDMDLIRRIRNEFAHSVEERNFNDEKVAQQCASLKCSSPGMDFRADPLARKQFVSSVFYIILRLIFQTLIWLNEGKLLGKHIEELDKNTLKDFDFIVQSWVKAHAELRG